MNSIANRSPGELALGLALALLSAGTQAAQVIVKLGPHLRSPSEFMSTHQARCGNQLYQVKFDHAADKIEIATLEPRLRVLDLSASSFGTSIMKQKFFGSLMIGCTADNYAGVEYSGVIVVNGVPKPAHYTLLISPGGEIIEDSGVREPEDVTWPASWRSF
jgi:hypothetical protein